MNTLKTDVNLMQVIINIQQMIKVISPKDNTVKRFNRLKKLTYKQLYDLQELVLIAYNETIKNRKK